jgi:hypothetical protein
MNDKVITTPIHCTVNGRQWHLFSAEYKADQGTYTLHFHAISMEHAAAVVEDIKATLTLRGELIGEVKA